jgi:hypothetical protein
MTKRKLIRGVAIVNLSAGVLSVPFFLSFGAVTGMISFAFFLHAVSVFLAIS